MKSGNHIMKSLSQVKRFRCIGAVCMHACMSRNHIMKSGNHSQAKMETQFSPWDKKRAKTAFLTFFPDNTHFQCSKRNIVIFIQVEISNLKKKVVPGLKLHTIHDPPIMITTTRYLNPVIYEPLRSDTPLRSNTPSIQIPPSPDTPPPSRHPSSIQTSLHRSDTPPFRYPSSSISEPPRYLNPFDI